MQICEINIFTINTGFPLSYFFCTGGFRSRDSLSRKKNYKNIHTMDEWIVFSYTVGGLHSEVALVSKTVLTWWEPIELVDSE